MRKSVFYLISASVFMFLSCNDASALFGKSKSKETVATKMFGTEIDTISKSTTNINNSVKTAKNKITKATQTLEKLSMSTRTFDTNTEVGTPLLISANLEFCASVLEKISQSLTIQKDGFTAINKAKNNGDAKAQEGRRLLRQSVKTLAVTEPLLAMLKGNIAMTAKYFKGKTQQVNNPGEAEKALKDLATAIADKKNKANGLSSLTTAYLDQFSGIYDGLTDKELKGWLTKGSTYAEKFKEIVELFKQFLDVSNRYLESGDPEEMIALGEECEAAISNTSVAIKQQHQTRNELKDLESKHLVTDSLKKIAKSTAEEEDEEDEEEEDEDEEEEAAAVKEKMNTKGANKAKLKAVSKMTGTLKTKKKATASAA